MRGHPKALYYLFFAELWERFSYYGMRALLVLYVVQRLYADMISAEADALGYGIYAAFGALVYATPVLGGMIADKFLGYRKAIMTGGVMMAIG
ncbi:MAG: MFS transporter, partial [Tenuifilaceae bacterium]|nr:MFS transporter [Tenuifilaceae bacterium]